MERTAADLFGLVRYPANMGGRLDFGPRTSKHPPFVGQVKNPRVQSLAVLTGLAVEMEHAAEAAQYLQQIDMNVFEDREHIGVVVVKHSNKRPTPHLVVMTEHEWLKIRKYLPFDWEIGARKKEEPDGGQEAG